MTIGAFCLDLSRNLLFLLPPSSLRFACRFAHFALQSRHLAAVQDYPKMERCDSKVHHRSSFVRSAPTTVRNPLEARFISEMPRACLGVLSTQGVTALRSRPNPSQPDPHLYDGRSWNLRQLEPKEHPPDFKPPGEGPQRMRSPSQLLSRLPDPLTGDLIPP